VEINREGISTLKVRIAREHGKLTGRIVYPDAHHSESCGSGYAVTEGDAHLAALAPALQFEEAEAGHQRNVGVAGSALDAEGCKRERTVRRKPGYASIRKLNLCSAVVSGVHLGAGKQRRIHQGRVGNDLATLRDSDLPLDTA
jgi:hypothetical protein